MNDNKNKRSKYILLSHYKGDVIKKSSFIIKKYFYLE